jgi:hypothetical protein
MNLGTVKDSARLGWGREHGIDLCCIIQKGQSWLVFFKYRMEQNDITSASKVYLTTI